MTEFPIPQAFVREFTQSMPDKYRAAYDAQAIVAHARLSLERGNAPAKVGAFVSHRAPGTPVCVVADDRPGLLAIISAAIVTCGLDVVYAEAHTRRTSRRKLEAVDIFFLRHADVEQRKLRVTRQEIEQLEATLSGMLAGTLDPEPASERLSAPPQSAPGTKGTIVRFLEGNDGVLSTLEVETNDRSGLLLALSRALFEQQVQIVESELKTVEDRVYDRFSIVELNGSPISPERRLMIQVAVLGAVEPVPVARRDSAPPLAAKQRG